MSLLNLLLGAITSQSSVNTLTHKTGGSSSQVNLLLALAVPILLKYLTKNASTQSGAESLFGALSQHKNTAAIPEQIDSADAEDGEKILAHILGSDSASVISNLSGESGMSESQVSSLLANIAPALRSGLSAATATTSKKKKKGIDLSDGIDLSELAMMFGGAGAASPKKEKDEFDGTALLGTLAALMK